MRPLERLHEAPDLPAFDLPPALSILYGGALGFAGPTLIGNFVSSLDGVVAIPSEVASPSVISGRSEADRFVMGLLRSCAGAVVVGAGTVRAEIDDLWTPAHIYPDAARDFALLRQSLGLSTLPELVILTGTGNVDPDTPALEDGALIITTGHGAARLKGRLPEACEVIATGNGSVVDPLRMLAALRARGHEIILSEGGPAVMGQLIERGLLDELFLTISPVLAGRIPSERRPGFVEGVDLITGSRPRNDLLSVSRHGSHLLLRYSLRPPAGGPRHLGAEA
jgi:riboflavin biosynthesis pyrimidine reductase